MSEPTIFQSKHVMEGEVMQKAGVKLINVEYMRK